MQLEFSLGVGCVAHKVCACLISFGAILELVLRF